ncbi:MAG: helix-turn-helix domain-containing protein [Thermodesulfobacteriota bacterium]
MNLQELGAVFKQERERRGLSVEDVVQRTKISRRNVVAIEAGRKEDLPHPVYAKGFVKNYARLLGLDPEEYAAALAQEYFVAEDDFGNDPTRDKPVSMTAARSIGGQRRRTGLRGVLLFLAAAALGGAILWSLLLTPSEHPVPPAPAPQAAPTESAPPDPAPLATPDPPAEEGAYTPPADLPPGDAAAAPVPEPAAEPEKTPPPDPKPAAAEPANPAPEARPAADAAPSRPTPAEPPKPAASAARVMDIRASQLCWVYAEVDGSIVLDITLQPGESKAIRFDKALTVKFGNAGGVKVALDSKPFPLNAQSGEVRTVTIP